MSVIETISDVENSLLSRRELVCNFAGAAGVLKKADAVDMVVKEFKLDGKTVLPAGLKNNVGQSLVTGTFYVYGDEALARSHVNPAIFKRLEKVKAAEAEAKSADADKDAAASPEEKPADDNAAKAAEAKPTGDAKDTKANSEEKPADDNAAKAAEAKPADDGKDAAGKS